MSYFELTGERTKLPLYPFDFHNHFAGILPVESDVIWEKSDRELECYDEKGQKALTEPLKVTIKAKQELSLIGILIPDASWAQIHLQGEETPGGKALLGKAKRKAHYDLFRLALMLIERKNPFGNDAFPVHKLPEYQRGECAAENIYLACCLLLSHIGNRTAYRIDEPQIYRSVWKMLGDPDYLKNNDDRAYPIIAYFNRKIFSANKYTPFDDAYWARDAVRDFADKSIQQKYNYASLCYLYTSGVFYVQIATSPGSIPRLNASIKGFEKAVEKGIYYKLLAHSPEVYASEEAFSNALGKITALFKTFKYENLTGIDLLSPETRTGLYKTCFDHLSKTENINIFKGYCSASQNACKKITIHIHCGEGSGVASNNRSFCGYYLYNAVNPQTDKFCEQLSAYACKCYNSTLQHDSDRRRERQNLGRVEKDFDEVSNLFDELFFRNKLTVDGLPLHRFDITSAISQNAVTYNAKTNSMHLCEGLRSPYVQDKFEYSTSYYTRLSGTKSPYSLRIGHAYYNRHYMAGAFPELCYDTNLGSNFITGASGLFDSAQIYRLNRGFRHLDGQISSAILERTLKAVAYYGDPLLNKEQMALAENNISPDEDKIKKHLNVPDFAVSAIKNFLNSTWHDSNDPNNPLFRASLLSVAINWRSYLFGSDAQGVEHSEVAKEAVRMAVVQTYMIQCVEKGNIRDSWISKLTFLFYELSQAYWKETVCEPKTKPSSKGHKIDRLNGFHGPNSALWIKTSMTKD